MIEVREKLTEKEEIDVHLKLGTSTEREKIINVANKRNVIKRNEFDEANS